MEKCILSQCPRTLKYDKEIKHIEGIEEIEINQYRQR